MLQTFLMIFWLSLTPCVENICMASFTDVSVHNNFLSDHFKSLMLFTNLHFASIIQCSCMTVTSYSCRCVVSVLVLHLYRLCVAT